MRRMKQESHKIFVTRFTQIVANADIFDIIILYYIFIYVIDNQNTSRECGQSAATCPGLSQSSQKIVAVLDREFVPTSSLSILQLKISWPGRSHISHTWPLALVMSELSVLLDTLLSRFLPSSKS